MRAIVLRGLGAYYQARSAESAAIFEKKPKRLVSAFAWNGYRSIPGGGHVSVFLALDMSRSVVAKAFDCDAWSHKNKRYGKKLKLEYFNHSDIHRSGYSSNKSDFGRITKYPSNYSELLVAPVYRAVVTTRHSEFAAKMADVMGLPLVKMEDYIKNWEHPAWQDVRDLNWAKKNVDELHSILGYHPTLIAAKHKDRDLLSIVLKKLTLLARSGSKKAVLAYAVWKISVSSVVEMDDFLDSVRPVLIPLARKNVSTNAARSGLSFVVNKYFLASWEEVFDMIINAFEDVHELALVECAFLCELLIRTLTCTDIEFRSRAPP